MAGRCIKQRLLCNGDNDCGDNSDETCDDGKDPKPACKTDIELSEIARTAGSGYNVLGMETKANTFDPEFFNGNCDKVRDGNTRTYYRRPWNVAALVYQTKADKSFTTETYDDATSVITKLIEEKTQTVDGSLSAKLTPTNLNGTTIGGKLGGNWTRKDSIQKVKEYTTRSNKQFLRVSGTVQLGTFQMRTRNIALTSTFIDDINNLPSFYDKGEYFAFLEVYGTHYALSGSVGGRYELVYVLDTIIMKNKDIDTSTVTKCLGFNAGINVKSTGFNVDAGVKPSNCDVIGSNKEDGKNTSGVIEKTISFVEGGQIDFTTILEEQLSKREKEIDAEFFSKWASSLIDAPVTIKQKLQPIYSLVPVDLHNAYNKTKFLERAIEDFIEEYSVCKCQPCQNGGTVVHIDGECVCTCPLQFTGLACQTLKKEALKKPDVSEEGHWSCWSPLSPCENGLATKTRTCNSVDGSSVCHGESSKTVEC
ncbi:complement component C9-like [Pseudophryne corroboree]|uniref:complement component C9-like n=1 Tax=Pseudophryne corroboree TaxID=495146 RepID=UPI00308121D8